jgi:hypothetical protein
MGTKEKQDERMQGQPDLAYNGTESMHLQT